MANFETLGPGNGEEGSNVDTSGQAGSKSVLDFIKAHRSDRDFELNEDAEGQQSTNSMPGSRAKLDTMAERVRQGLPIWHDNDRKELDERTIEPTDVRRSSRDR